MRHLVPGARCPGSRVGSAIRSSPRTPRRRCPCRSARATTAGAPFSLRPTLSAPTCASPVTGSTGPWSQCRAVWLCAGGDGSNDRLPRVGAAGRVSRQEDKQERFVARGSRAKNVWRPATCALLRFVRRSSRLAPSWKSTGISFQQRGEPAHVEVCRWQTARQQLVDARDDLSTKRCIEPRMCKPVARLPIRFIRSV